LQHWWGVLRPWSFTASFIPISLGAVLAWNEGIFHPELYLLTLAGGIAVHAGTNLMNSYGDYVSGVDTVDSASHLQLVTGLIPPAQVKAAGWIFFSLAALIGLWLATFRGWPVLASGLIGVIFGYSYTMGPRPYKYDGLGPIAIFFLMGPCMVWPAYYIQTGQFSWLPVWASLPICFLISGFHHSNDMRDMQYDQAAGIKTLALFLGRDISLRLFQALFIGAFISTLALLWVGILPWSAMLPLLLWPVALKMFAKAREAFYHRQEQLAGLEGMAAGFHFKFGFLLVLGTLLHPWLSRFIPAIHIP
jgi:1,4-dihydroxy-2-naphthoate polyprenyltransferase